MRRSPQVALLVESSRAYGRGLLLGVARYARLHGRWSIYHYERTLNDPAPSWLEKWKGQGIIARLENPRLVKAVLESGLPVVDLRGLHNLPDIPLVETNDRSVVRLALDHLIERGFTRIAYCGFENTNYSQRRLRYLQQLIAERGLSLDVYASSQGHRPRTGAGDTVAAETQGLLFEGAIARWLAELPKPIGVIACNDIRGQQVLNAAREHRISVPEELAVIGVDNDEVLCELSDPPLSSVEPNTQLIGFEAAALLDRMMKGHRPADGKVFIEPSGVVTRQSTDVLAMADREVAAAVRFIRQHATDDISVEDVLDQVPLSRSTLERRFGKVIGRSPKAEILRVRLERAKRLLAETDYSLLAIAQMTGFKHAEYLSVVFKQKTKQTPGQFRAASRSGMGK
jgi:LacI family transcriptional regulator